MQHALTFFHTFVTTILPPCLTTVSYYRLLLPSTTTTRAAAAVGLLAGMVVTHVNNYPVNRNSYSAILKSLKHMKNEDGIVIATHTHMTHLNTMEKLAGRLR